ncbi:MAG: hypothetical protein ACO20A_11530, partial [Candidatus Nanopelagicales bacterium]
RAFHWYVYDGDRAGGVGDGACCGWCGRWKSGSDPGQNLDLVTALAFGSGARSIARSSVNTSQSATRIGS